MERATTTKKTHTETKQWIFRLDFFLSLPLCACACRRRRCPIFPYLVCAFAPPLSLSLSVWHCCFTFVIVYELQFARDADKISEIRSSETSNGKQPLVCFNNPLVICKHKWFWLHRPEPNTDQMHQYCQYTGYIHRYEFVLGCLRASEWVNERTRGSERKLKFHRERERASATQRQHPNECGCIKLNGPKRQQIPTKQKLNLVSETSYALAPFHIRLRSHCWCGWFVFWGFSMSFESRSLFPFFFAVVVVSLAFYLFGVFFFSCHSASGRNRNGIVFIITKYFYCFAISAKRTLLQFTIIYLRGIHFGIFVLARIHSRIVCVRG